MPRVRSEFVFHRHRLKSFHFAKVTDVCQQNCESRTVRIVEGYTLSHFVFQEKFQLKSTDVRLFLLLVTVSSESRSSAGGYQLTARLWQEQFCSSWSTLPKGSVDLIPRLQLEEVLEVLISSNCKVVFVFQNPIRYKAIIDPLRDEVKLSHYIGTFYFMRCEDYCAKKTF